MAAIHTHYIARSHKSVSNDSILMIFVYNVMVFWDAESISEVFKMIGCQSHVIQVKVMVAKQPKLIFGPNPVLADIVLFFIDYTSPVPL